MVLYTCPHCHTQVRVERREALPTRPFCSPRCQQIDFGRWLTGAYVISDPLPGTAAAEFSGDDADEDYASA